MTVTVAVYPFTPEGKIEAENEFRRIAAAQEYMFCGMALQRYSINDINKAWKRGWVEDADSSWALLFQESE